ncbi:MAG TPA: DUF4362 domain-containing protein [Bacilli bacterium]|nr:DUF4362 domain-containing protein [Bacilli bacterium]
MKRHMQFTVAALVTLTVAWLASPLSDARPEIGPEDVVENHVSSIKNKQRILDFVTRVEQGHPDAVRTVTYDAEGGSSQLDLDYDGADVEIWADTYPPLGKESHRKYTCDRLYLEEGALFEIKVHQCTGGLEDATVFRMTR